MNKKRIAQLLLIFGFTMGIVATDNVSYRVKAFYGYGEEAPIIYFYSGQHNDFRKSTVQSETGLKIENILTTEKILEELMENAKLQEEERVAFIRSHGGNPEFRGTLGERALEEAFTQIGKPYLWGAEGAEDYDEDGDIRDGFDCSGLIYWAYHRQGKTDLPRTTMGQWIEGERISREDIRKGDLIYFLNNKTNRFVDHVGIYVGDNFMLHAPRPGKTVEIKPIYWRNMVSIRRHH